MQQKKKELRLSHRNAIAGMYAFEHRFGDENIHKMPFNFIPFAFFVY